ncbi:high affinity immunoglobulin gamma Fc receptor I-like [Ictalurus furcatus]|uniref:high affinity immunoglobulin gamma Fc receptor I-like n=1 Tax=Ictalurus furcatus TaxID=66913 RepID=UPI00235050B8|nr:high affinity immunoglobulin gamma Fc receptor I-like [Ictalurus furcatus]XP_053483945.1 high affinity immunoglobulin gamma Fc receptor I-like [Ictalurus furcatus]
MELRPLRVMILLISLIRVGQAQEFKLFTLTVCVCFLTFSPVLSVEPNSPQIFRGETVTLTCRLLGWRGPYYWNKDGVNVHSSAENYYTINVDQSHKYRCYVSIDGWSTTWSNEVTLSVIALPKPVVSINPDEQVYRGETVTLRCDLQDEEDSDWIYSWNKDGSGVSSEQEYRISSAETSHAGKYTCRGRERGGSHSSHTSDAVTLTVSEKPKPELTPSREGAVLKGNSVTLSCTLKLQSAAWRFYWIKPTQSTETETEYYNISSVRVSDGGQYRCRAGRGNPVYYTHYSDAFWVNVTDGKAPLSVLKLLSSAVAASPYVLVTIILAVKCYRARTDPDEDNRPYRVIEAEASV